jgi:hypothetical protein
MVRRPALGILLTSLLLYQASARHHTGPDHHTGADPLRPFVERVVVDKIVILTQVNFIPCAPVYLRAMSYGSLQPFILLQHII